MTMTKVEYIEILDREATRREERALTAAASGSDAGYAAAATDAAIARGLREAQLLARGLED